MVTPKPTTAHERTAEEAWRYERLRDLGFNRVQAEDLIEHPDVAHEAADMVNAGCSPAVAYRILRE